MNEYIFYTAEGYTYAPNEKYEVENCQILGIVKGKDKCEAQKILLKENPWIIKAGFNPSEFYVRQLISDNRTNFTS